MNLNSISVHHRRISTLTASAVFKILGVQYSSVYHCPRQLLRKNYTTAIKMKEAIVNPGITVDIKDSPMPEIKDPRQLIIRVVVSGSNPKEYILTFPSSAHAFY